MSAGTAAVLVRTWLLEELSAAIPSVQVHDAYPTQNDQLLAESGRIEVIYLADVNSRMEVRSFRATQNVKMNEVGVATVVVTVGGVDADDTQSVVDARAAELLGEIVKVVVSGQPSVLPPTIPQVTVTVGDMDLSTGAAEVGGSTYTHTAQIEVGVEFVAQIEL